MRAPRVILFRGVRYVRAAHERCKPNPQTGELQHWNEKQRKCLPVSSKTRSAMIQAHARTGDANRASRSAHPASAHGFKPDATFTAKKHSYAAKLHHQAAETHKQTALLLYDQGFHELATQHRQYEHQHQAHEAKHQAGQHPEL